MPLFTVDPDLCLRDGLCVEECPRFLVELKDEAACPTPALGAADECTNCGHCVAVCPVGALSLETMPVESLPEVNRALVPSGAQVDYFLRTRRSIRGFAKEPLAREEIVSLLELATYAPSGTNRQPVEWLVIYEEQRVRRVGEMVFEWLRGQEMPEYRRSIAVAAENGYDLTLRGAPHLVVAHTPSARVNDGVIALTYLELAAYARGIGACWGGFANSAINGTPALREFIGLPEGRVSAGTMMLGRARNQFNRIPARNASTVVWA